MSNASRPPPQPPLAFLSGLYQKIGTEFCSIGAFIVSAANLVPRSGVFVSMTMENQIRNLRIAFENGKIPKDLYAKNLLRLLGLSEHATAQKLGAAFLGNLRSAPSPPSDPIDLPPP